jgi:hypothetical protein
LAAEQLGELPHFTVLLYYIIGCAVARYAGVLQAPGRAVTAFVKLHTGAQVSAASVIVPLAVLHISRSMFPSHNSKKNFLLHD